MRYEATAYANSHQCLTAKSTSCSHLDQACKRQVASVHDSSHTQHKILMPCDCHQALGKMQVYYGMPVSQLDASLLHLTAANSPITSPTNMPKCPAPTADPRQNFGCCNWCRSLPAAAGRVPNQATTHADGLLAAPGSMGDTARQHVTPSSHVFNNYNIVGTTQA